MTTESLDSKTRSNPQWLKKVGCVVVDEAHLIASENRGDSLEIGLMRFTAINREARIILLSATIPNAEELGAWLTKLNGKRTIIQSTKWRPVEQEHYLVRGGNKPWEIIKDVFKTIAKAERLFPNKQMLIFVHAIGRGKKIAEELGCPFHYSKLSREKRASIEDAYKAKKLKRLVCTSTLAYGVNLPADIAIIAGCMRGPTFVDPIDIKQEAGRAGRYGLSDKGYVFYVFEKQFAAETFKLCLKTPPVHSVLDKRLYFHIVSFIHREAMQKEEIEAFIKRAFAKNVSIETHLETLKKYEVIKPTEYLSVTKFGKAASLLYLDPIDLVALYHNLSDKPEESSSIAKAFSRIPSNEIPCYIPKDIEYYIQKRYGEAGVNLECGYAQQTINACCLDNWMRGETLQGTFATVTHNLIRNIGRWVSALQIAGISKDYMKAISVMLINGIPYHLIDLASIKGIGRIKAMKLFEAEIKTVSDILDKEAKAVSILGRTLFNKIKFDEGNPGQITFNF